LFIASEVLDVEAECAAVVAWLEEGLVLAVAVEAVLSPADEEGGWAAAEPPLGEVAEEVVEAARGEGAARVGAAREVEEAAAAELLLMFVLLGDLRVEPTNLRKREFMDDMEVRAKATRARPCQGGNEGPVQRGRERGPEGRKWVEKKLEWCNNEIDSR
jgi:hypothetical protein